MPPRLLEAPETTSAVMGDFQEPYGAVTLCLSAVVSEDDGAEAMVFCFLGCGLTDDDWATRIGARLLKVDFGEELRRAASESGYENEMFE